jgi:hypothetical protein
MYSSSYAQRDNIFFFKKPFIETDPAAPRTLFYKTEQRRLFISSLLCKL